MFLKGQWEIMRARQHSAKVHIKVQTNEDTLSVYSMNLQEPPKYDEIKKCIVYKLPSVCQPPQKQAVPFYFHWLKRGQY